MSAETHSPSTPQTVRLTLRDLGEITSFKNTKMILPAKGKRRAMLITNPAKQKQMESYIQSFESQLRSLWQTSATGMGTGCSLASWIRSFMPLDDSRKWIPSGSFEFVEVPKGSEGAMITITPL